MSRDDILNMPVGRELDALVAKRVMFPGHSHPLEEIKGWCQKYSTNISSAWEVVEQIKKKFTLRITINQSFTAVEYWDHKTARIEKFLTTPEAICKASLLATLEVV